MKSEGLRKTIEDSKELFTEIGEEIKVQSKKREELNQKHRDFLRQREELAKHVSDLDKEWFPSEQPERRLRGSVREADELYVGRV